MEGKVWAQCSVKSFHSVLKTIMMPPLKYGHGPVICLSANMGSHALKVHALAGGASQLTVMFNSWPCVFDWFHSRWVGDNRRRDNGVEGGGEVAS